MVKHFETTTNKLLKHSLILRGSECFFNSFKNICALKQTALYTKMGKSE